MLQFTQLLNLIIKLQLKRYNSINIDGDWTEYGSVSWYGFQNIRFHVKMILRKNTMGEIVTSRLVLYARTSRSPERTQTDTTNPARDVRPKRQNDGWRCIVVNSNNPYRHTHFYTEIRWNFRITVSQGAQMNNL